MSRSCISYYLDKNGNLGVTGVVLLANAYALPYLPGTVVIFYLTGCACIAAAVSKGLKRVIKQHRPPGALKASPGMPSNHATSLSFLGVTIVYGLQRYTDSTAAFRGTHQAFIQTPSLPFLPLSPLWPVQVLVVVYSLYATSLRVIWGHHTVAQVCAGYALGLLFAILSLSANYSGYTGSRAGGRVDDLTLAARVVVILASCSITAMATRSIIRGARAPCVARTGSSCS